MSQLGNSPRSHTTLTLERAKSFAFGMRFRDTRRHPVDVDAAEVRLVISKPRHRGGEQLVVKDAEVVDAALGLIQFPLQAADLDLAEGEYPFVVVLEGATGYSTAVLKGTIDILDNAESESAARQYSGVNPGTNLAVALEEGNVVNVTVENVDGLSLIVEERITDFADQMDSKLVVAEGQAAEAADQADAATIAAQASAASSTAAAASAQVAATVALSEASSTLAIAFQDESSVLGAGLRAVVADEVQDSSTAIGGALAATIDAGVAPIAAEVAALPSVFSRPVGNTIALLGDSISAQSSGFAGVYDATPTTLTYFNARGYYMWANALLDHRLTLLKNAGVPGERADQIAARVTDVTSLPVLPRFCVVLAGTNDITVPRTYSQITASLLAIHNALRAKGITVVACTIPPRTGLDAAKTLLMAQVNDWIRAQATQPNTIVCDWTAQVADTTTAAARTGAMWDGLHPASLGASAMGKALASALRPYIGGSPLLVASNADPLNLIANGLMLGTTGGKTGGATGSNADSWTTSWPIAGSAVFSKVARTDGAAGEWLQIAMAGGTLSVFQNVPTGPSWAVGDKVVASVEWEADAAGWALDRFQLRCYTQGAGAQSGYDGYQDQLEAITYPGARGVLQTPVTTITGTPTALTMALNLSGAGTVRFSRASVKKVA